MWGFAGAASAAASAGTEVEDDAPRPTLRILRARSGGWDEIAKGAQDLAVKVTEPGAYRAEVRILPHHLQGYLSSYADLADQDFVWIYSNPVYVVD